MSNNEQLVERLSHLPVAVISDSLDKLGARQRVLDPAIRPVSGGNGLAGVAFTLQAVERGLAAPAQDDGRPTYDMGIEAVDAIPAGAVIVVATGGFRGAAAWGELLSTRAQALGGVGAVTDGAVRDIAGIDRLGYPTYAGARCAMDAQGRMAIVSYGEQVVCGGIVVETGDLVRADDDGVVILPAALAEEAIEAAEERRSGEAVVRSDLRSGRTVAAVFEEYGLL